MSLAVKAAAGAVWTITTSVGGRIATLVATLIITRFIAPEVYGEVMASWAVVETAAALTTFGLAQYLIVNPKEGRDVAFHATFFQLTMGTTALIVAVLLSDQLAPIFNAPKLAEYLPLLALSMGIDLIAYTPTRVLNRDLRFRMLSIGRTVGEFTYAGVGIALAIADYGGMAVVFANLSRAIVRSSVLTLSVHWKDWALPVKLSMATTKKLFAFGTPLFLSNLAEMGARRWDNLLVAGMFGPAALGRYNFAYNLADVPATHVGEHIGDVLIPSFARIDSASARKRGLVRAMGLLTLIVFPLAVGLGAIAETAVSALFSEEWQGMAPMLTLLSALSVTRPVGWTMQGYILAYNRTKTVGLLEATKAILVVGTIASVGRLGELWICVAVGLAFGTHALLSMLAVKRADGLPLLHVLKPQVGPLLACIPMAGAVFGVRYVGTSMLGLSPAPLLVAEIVGGGLVYIPAALVLAKDQAFDLLGLMKKLIDRKRGRGGDSEPPSSRPSSPPSSRPSSPPTSGSAA